jgi:hypothetical protein
MNVIIQKLNGLWYLIVELVISYARRVYPGAKIFERGLILAVAPHSAGRHWRRRREGAGS